MNRYFIFLKKELLFVAFFISFINNGYGQITLGMSSYTQNFNNLNAGLPSGWTVRTAATASSLGTVTTFNQGSTAWSTNTGGYHNCASASAPATALDNSTVQAANTNRALAARQNTGGSLDPGAAIVLQLTNTSGLTNFSLSFILMELDPTATPGRTTTWNVDYGFGAAPSSFTNATTSPATLTTTLGNGWGTTNVTVNFGSVLDNKSQNVWIRVCAKSLSSGSGSRPLTAIDDFALTYSNISMGNIPIAFCQNTAFSIPYTVTSPFTIGNNFIAQLSNASGSFASPVNIGSASGVSSGTINATIPASAVPGSGYRIRIVSTNPAQISGDDGTNLTIGSPATISVSGCNHLFSGSTLLTSVKTGGGPDSAYQWTRNGTSVAVTQNYTASATGDYVVTFLDDYGCTAVSPTFTLYSGSAPLIGTYNIPDPVCGIGSLASMVSLINSNGVSGPVTINVATGYTEIAPSGGYSINMCGLASSIKTNATNTLTIQRSGGGANPLLTAQVGSTINSDAIFKIIGADYVTINGIDLRENATNSNINQLMEWGYAILKCNGNDGANHNMIQNCHIVLKKNLVNCYGIYSGNHGTNPASPYTYSGPTTAAAIDSSRNGNNRIFNNTIDSCYIGIYMGGNTSLLGNFTLGDTLNQIGNSENGNTINSFGGGSLVASAIWCQSQYDVEIGGNDIIGGTGSTNFTHGVRILNGIKCAVDYNSMTLQSASLSILPIYCNMDNGTTLMPQSIVIRENYIQNCSYDAALTTGFNGISNLAGGVGDIEITNNHIVNNTFTTGNITFNGISSSTSPTSLTITGNDINGNSNNNTPFTGINISGNPGSLIISGNAINNTTTTGAGTFTAISSSVSGSGLRRINDNAIQTNTLTSTSTFNGIVNTGSPSSLSINGNLFDLNTKNGIGIMSFISYGSASAAVIDTNIISNNTLIGGGGACTINCITGGAINVSVSQNSLLNTGITSMTSSNAGSISGINHNSSSTTNEVINNNNISTLFVGGGTATYLIRGIIVTASGSSTRSILSNIIDSLYSPSGSSANITGITSSTANNVTIEKNKISNLQPGGQSGLIKGILISGGNFSSVYNNVIGIEYVSPVLGLGGTSALAGIDVTSGILAKLYFNTIRLAGSSTGTNFGSNGIVLNSTTPDVDIRNNIVVNLSTPTGTGLACGLRRTNAGLTGYSSTSDRNIYYCGSPSATHPIYYDQSTAYQTLAAFKAAVSPLETYSKTENVHFQSTVASSPNFLKIDNLFSTFAESGARPITSPLITHDFFGNLRNTTTPDIGAHEDNFTNSGIMISQAVAVPSYGQCTAVSHDVTALVIPGSLTGSIVKLYYSFNGTAGAGSPVTMVYAGSNYWTGTIPAATPTNAAVTWHVTASDNSLIDNQDFIGVPYQDNYLPTLIATASPVSFCPSAPIVLTAKQNIPTAPAASSYCTSYHTSGCSGDQITHVVLNTLDVNTGSSCGGTSHYTYFNGGGTQTTTLPVNNNYSLTLTFGGNPNQYFGAWIDYDHDGLYEVSEFLGASNNAGANGTTFINFFVAATVYNGQTHMRIVGGNDTPVTSSQACGISSSNFGETQDYDVTISGGVSTILPTGITSYSWSSGAGPIASTNPVQVFSPSQGNVTYTVTGTDANGCTSTSQVVCTAIVPGNILLTTTDSIVCSGDSITLTAQTDFPASSYVWTPTGGLYNGSPIPALTPQITFYPISNQYNSYTYNYIVTVVNSQTGCAQSDTVEVLVNRKLIATAIEPFPDECIHEQNLVEVSAIGGTLPYEGTGSFNVDGGEHIYTVTDAAGCSDIDTVYTIGEMFFNVPDTLFICFGDDSTVSLSQYIVGGQPPFNIWGDTTQLTDDDYNFSLHDSQGCAVFTSTHVSIINCIIPPTVPSDSGKTAYLIGSDLMQIYENPGIINDTTNTHYVTNQYGDILIEVVANVGYYTTVFDLLQTPTYGMTDLFSNGDTTLIITGFYPIANLLLLNDLITEINTVRAYNPPINNSYAAGIAYSLGDSSIHGGGARAIFGVEGDGVKVGVISDSYNTIPGNYAQIDVNNGDLPGVGNPYNSFPVEVLQDYPYGARTDEGRAMLQIVHDIAPKAKLAFRTGFISQGDFADGILALKAIGCNEIVDDITFINEPFFKDGVISHAVDYVKSQGVSYFTAAGNFGAKSYEGVFNPVAAPAGFIGLAHNFGGGDVKQGVSLAAGLYTIVLQWEDSIYSLGEMPGALNDLDIFLLDNEGNKLFGFNRENTGEDPIEILQFLVRAPTTANILITKKTGNANVRFKYIAFRGELKIDEHNSGFSTIVGQGNAAGAMTVGAVFYTKTPAFGTDQPYIASFSSIGGTRVEGMTRSKPDFCAPNGVNTTVNFGHFNIDSDFLPNFFGTSASAPHAAGAAALLINAKKKFFNAASLSPDSVRLLLKTTTLEMEINGPDSISGSGLIQVDSAIQKFASPRPIITQLVTDPAKIPGSQTFTATIKGKYFKSGSVVYLGAVALTTTFVNTQKLTASVPTFSGNPAVRVYNPPVTTSGLDGGYSDPKYFLSTNKKTIKITADNKTKKFGEAIPTLTATVLVDGVPYQNTAYTLASLGLSAMQITTSATTASGFGLYFIRPSITPLNPAVPADAALLAQFDYIFNDGILTNNKLPVTITARDTTFSYGKKIRNLNFNYTYNESLIPVGERAAFLSSLRTLHQSAIDTNIVVIDDQVLINGRSVAGIDMTGIGVVASRRAINNGRSVAGRATTNGLFNDTTNVVDLSPESLFNYQVDSSVATLINDYALVSGRSVAGRTAQVNGVYLTNETSLINAITANDSTRNSSVVIVDAEDVDAPAGDLIEYKPINLVTGLRTGTHYIVPGALLSGNFDVNYASGTLTISPSTIYLKAEDKTFTYGATNVFTSKLYNYQYSDTDSVITSGPVTFVIKDFSNNVITTVPTPVGTYQIVPDVTLENPSNYVLNKINGTLTISPSISLNIKMYIAGFYTGGGLMDNGGSGGNLYLLGEPGAVFEDVDTINVSLMEPDPPYSEIESAKGILQTDGALNVSIGSVVTNGDDYYLKITHRNLVETWSKNPVTLSAVTTYDFTNSSTKAFDDGSTLPMKLIDTSPNRWGMYNGDIDQDGGVTALDMTFEENDSNLGAFGYYPTDLNGDGASGSLDMTIIENNGNLGVFTVHP